MKTSFRVLIISCCVPIFYPLIVNGILRNKYNKGEILNAEEIDALRYTRHNIPNIDEVRIEDIPRVSVVFNNQQFLEIENNAHKKTILHEIDGSALRILLDPNQTNLRGSQHAVLHLPSRTMINAQNSKVNIVVNNEHEDVKISAKNCSLYFINNLLPSFRNPKMDIADNIKYRSRMSHLHLDLANSSLSFPQNFEMDSLSGHGHKSQINLGHILLKKYNLKVDNTSTVTLPGSLIKELRQER